MAELPYTVALLVRRTIQNGPCELVILDSKLPYRGLASRPNDPEIFDDLRKRKSQNPQPELQLTKILLVGTDLLEGRKSPHCSYQSAGMDGFKVVQAIGYISHDGKGDFALLLQQPLPEAHMREKAIAKLWSFDTGRNLLGLVQVDAHLSSYLDEHQDPLLVVAKSLAVQFCPCDLDGSLCCAIRGSSEPVGEHSQENRGSYAQERTHCRPCVPPQMAILRQRPALADPIQHAHSLIPLWIGRHSATVHLHG